ncbi:MAG: hypothetical protein ABJN24_01120 [Hyphomicrobiales bacterium]
MPNESNAKRVDEQRKDFYLRSYPAIIEIARSKTLNTETRLLQLACATYGWMPTIPKNLLPDIELGKFRLDEVVALKSDGEAREYIEARKKPLINNSWIGTSKMLHFINPKHFPIWDSRIAGTLFGEGTNANSKNRYQEYCKKIHAWNEEDPQYGVPLANAIEKEYRYKPNNLRCIELALFSMSQG